VTLKPTSLIAYRVVKLIKLENDALSGTGLVDW